MTYISEDFGEPFVPLRTGLSRAVDGLPVCTCGEPDCPRCGHVEPGATCKFCGRELRTDQLPSAAIRAFGRERAQREMARCHARGMCFECGMSP